MQSTTSLRMYGYPEDVRLPTRFVGKREFAVSWFCLVWRVPAFVAMFSAFFILAGPLVVLLNLSKNLEYPGTTKKLETLRRLWVSQLAKLAIRVVGLRVRTSGLGADERRSYSNLFQDSGRGICILANHLNYIDAILLMAEFGYGRFVSSQQMRQTPFLGWILGLSNALVVDRRRISRLPQEIQDIQVTLAKGDTVMFFPEGTTGNGESLLPFRSSLLEAAVQAESWVVPVCINFRRISGEPVSLAGRDQIFWYDDMSFLPHFFWLLAAPSIEVDLLVGEALLAKDRCRKELMGEVRDFVAENYRLLEAETDFSSRVVVAELGTLKEGSVDDRRLRTQNLQDLNSSRLGGPSGSGSISRAVNRGIREVDL
jgi:lyso-ornithine lipid O-acyltransferase